MNRRKLLENALALFLGGVATVKTKWGDLPPGDYQGECITRIFVGSETLTTFGPIRVYLDGEEVADRCLTMRAPVSPNLEAAGWCELIGTDLEMPPETRRGMVWWEPDSEEGKRRIKIGVFPP